MKKPYRHCSAILVIRLHNNEKRELLLVRKDRKRDAWQLPQGGIEQGESSKEAAVRELMEETGISAPSEELKETDISYEYDYPRRFIKEQDPPYRGQALVFFILHIDSDTKVIIDNDEIVEYRWVILKELSKYVKRRSYRKVINKLTQSMSS